MAIGKWISFGTAQSSPAAPVVVAAQPPAISSADAKQFGLENFGNTCYANSVLQALYFCGPFRELLVQYPDPSAPTLPFSSPPPPRAPLPPAAQPQPPPPHARRRLDRKYSVSEAPSPHLSTSSSHASAACAIPPHPPTLLSALRSLFVHISKNPAERGTVAPRAFIEKLKELNELFRGSMHQDAHEFLNFLLNKIVEEMETDRRNGVGAWQTNGVAHGAANGVANGNANGDGVANGSAAGSTLGGEDLSSSITTLSTTAAGPSFTDSKTSQPSAAQFQTTLVHRLFEGVLTSETRCLTCETVSSRDESFLDLSIDIEQNSSVTACLRQFSASEMLCQKNKFFCDSCCDLQEAEKRMKIKKLPNILALHLKRFKYQEDVGKYIKLAYRVAFPLELRLFNTVDDAENPDRLYELFAIVVHIGNGPHHGHYVTIIKARGTWLLFDDDSVDVIKESEIPRYYGESTNGSAYVLYYQAVDLDMAALGLKTPVPAPAPSAADIGSAPAMKPANTLSVSASSEVDLGSPTVPPGLTEEDSSERSESSSPLPATPASQPLPLSSGHQAVKGPSASMTPLTIPSQSTSGPSTPAQSTALGSSSALGGLFSTLRHSRSARETDIRKSWLNVEAAQVPPMPSLPSPTTGKRARRPRTAASTASTAEGNESPSEPSSPSLRNGGGANGAGSNAGTGGGKSPEKKQSGWFKRKSSRLDVSFNGTVSSSSANKEDAAHPRSQTVKEGASVSRHLSASASGWTPAVNPSTVPSAFAMTPLPPPAGPSSPAQPRSGGPDHKKSTPELQKSMRSKSLTASALGKLPRRPSTAGATVGSSSSRPMSDRTPPLPPLPGSPQVPLRERRAEGDPQQTAFPSSTALLPPSPRADHTSHSHPPPSSERRRPNTSHGSSPTIGISMSTSTSSGTSYGSPVESTPAKKRAPRKLSFTAPMLGFGRREKERHKDQLPPSSFAR
ncbi:cysteine proteinase [Daedalea quercina L-15889]|uniref:Ubiquitin carboxyl-terminal hydrolase n=1 Tax=Daedalea quercina L-15889 TaxID=1314783 RepID=A0A165KVH2_9APHY|nr:cysteine proteinase [Daedalea quercina L-15889]